MRHTNALDPVAAYDATATFTLPGTLGGGTYYALVRTDHTNLILEDPLENNNDHASAAITITPVTPGAPGAPVIPDLRLVSVDAPDTALSGQAFTVSWTVRNDADPTGNRSWYDAVYLSRDQIFDRQTDSYAGHLYHNGGLNTNESYSATQTFTVPNGLSGPFYIFVATDSGDQIAEGAWELNNTGYDGTSMLVSLAPPADLVVGTITVPANAVPGRNATIAFSVRNEGENTAFGSWYDSIYISADDLWDVSDALFGRVLHSGAVSEHSSYSNNLTTALPGVIPGDYHVIIRSDILNHIPESNENNNIGASLDQVAIDAEALQLGVAATSTLAQGQAVYYRIDVGAGETLRLSFDSVAEDAGNELYIRFNTMPTRGQFDFAATVPFTPDQELIVPTTQAGTYYVLAYGSLVSGASSYSILAETIPFSVRAVKPGEVGNAGPSTLEIHGAQFARGTTFHLFTPDGGKVAAERIIVQDSTTAYVTFNLSGYPTGLYDVQATRETGATVTLFGGLSLVTGSGGHLETSIDGPPTVRPGRLYIFNVHYANSGNADVVAPLFLLRSPTNTPVGFSPDSMVAGETLQILGISSDGPADFLRKSAPESVSLYFQSSTNPVNFRLDTLTADDPRPIEWSVVESLIRPERKADAQWSSAWPLVQARIGATWGDYVRTLARNAALLPAELGSNRDPRPVLDLEISKAFAALGISISGIASASDLEVDLSGQDVVVRNTTTGQTFTTISLNDGSFVFEKVTAGSYEFAFGGAIITSGNAAVVMDSQSVQGVSLGLVAGAQISGKVRGAGTATLVDSATVTAVAGDGAIYTAVTDSEGQYTLKGIAHGSYSLIAEANGWARARLMNVVVNEERLVHNFDLMTESTISGNISLEPGGPSTGVLRVSARSVSDPDPANVFVGEGRGMAFMVDGLPAGSYVLTISHDGYVPAETIVAVGASQTVDIGTINLALGATVSGSIASSVSANPAGFAFVEAYDGNTQVAAVQADSNGAFTITGLLPGTYTLRVSPVVDGFATAPVVTVTRGEAITGVSIQIQPGGVITGTLRETDTMEELAGVPVVLIDTNGNRSSALTDASGIYRFTGLDIGTYVISLPISAARSSSAATIMALDGTQVTADLEVDVVATLGGHLLNAGGAPMPGLVSLYEAGLFITSTATDLNGNFSFLMMRGGTFDFRAVAEGASFAPVNGVSVNVGDTIQRDIQAGTGSLHITLDDPTQSVQDSMVLLFQELPEGRGLVGTQRVDSNGVTAFNSLAAGDYRIEVIGGNNHGADASVTLPSNTSANLIVTLTHQSALTGRITDTAGNPVASARLALISNHDRNSQLLSITEAEGTYAFSHVPAGDYELIVIAEGYQASIGDIVSVSGSTVADVMLEASTTELTGNLVNPHSDPVPNGTVDVQDASGRTIGTAVVASDGSFQVTTASGNDLTVIVFSPGTAGVVLSGVDVGSGLSLNLGNIAIQPLALGQRAVSTSTLASASGMSFELKPLANGTPGWLQSMFSDYARQPDELRPGQVAPLGDCTECAGLQSKVLKAIFIQGLAFETVGGYEESLGACRRENVVANHKACRLVFSRPCARKNLLVPQSSLVREALLVVGHLSACSSALLPSLMS